MNDHFRFIPQRGDMARRVRALDWAATRLGPVEAWPEALKSALSLTLHSAFPTAIYWGPEHVLIYNDAWAPIPAERHPWALGRPGAEVWADIWDVVGPQMQHVVESGEGLSIFDQMLPMERDGRPRETYWNYSFTPIIGADGRVAGVLNQGHEVTDRVLLERRQDFLIRLSDALRSLDDPREIIRTAQRMLGQQLRASRVGYGDVDPSERFFTTAHNWAQGVPSREGTHDLAGFGPAVHAMLKAGEPLVIEDAATDPRSRDPQSLAAFDAIETRAVITASLVKNGHMVAALYVHCNEPRSWTEVDSLLVQDVAERTWTELARARAEAHQELLVAELNHRVKNTLAIVQSLAHQSFSAERPADEAVSAFEGRLTALATAHGLLTRANWEAADLRDLAGQVLAPFCAERCTHHGPEVRVSPQTAVSLTLALHELATNAAKYGALSNDTGTVSLSWTLADGAIELLWIERGGPPTVRPSTRGFGTRMIERALAAELRGTVTLDFGPEGVICRVRAPLSEALQQ